jgi:ubiquinone biosynthesis protein
MRRSRRRNATFDGDLDTQDSSLDVNERRASHQPKKLPKRVRRSIRNIVKRWRHAREDSLSNHLSPRGLGDGFHKGDGKRGELESLDALDLGDEALGRLSLDSFRHSRKTEQTSHQFPGARTEKDIYARLPRRKPLEINTDITPVPDMMRQVVFKASLVTVVSRLMVWFLAVIRYFTGKYWDQLLRRDSVERRAIRLREIIERIGGTAVKIGQQMSMRIDLLPYAYGAELSKMMDKMPAFPTEYARAAIKRQIGKPLTEVFSIFDPEPIGSASVACVYQAILKNGEKVAVKVRRPRIGEIFVADCRAIGWLCWVLEYLTILRPGLSRNFQSEFRNMLLEELDFVKEARYSEIFRRRVKNKLPFVTAPRVYFDYSGEDVMVAEFVSGIWLGEIMTAVEHEDEKALEKLRRLRIDPKTVALRLFETNQFGIFENLLFHADPHPANVLVQPGNKIILIDFGSCGAYTEKERHVWRQLAYYQHEEDVGHMVQCALAILEPLPAIDLDEFAKRLEAVFWQDLYAFKSKHAQWWERTSAKIWISFLNLSREYNAPLNLNTLRMIRSTLLYETIAARLYKDMDTYGEHYKYIKRAGKRARKRVRKTVLKFFTRGLGKRNFLRVEQFGEMANRIFYLTQRFVDSPGFRFSLLIGKAVYAGIMIVRAVLTVTAASLIAIGVIVIYKLTFDSQYTLQDAVDMREMLHLFVQDLLKSRLFLFFILVVVFLHLRRILFRLWDKEIPRRNASGLN